MKKASDAVNRFFDNLNIRDDKNYAGFYGSWKNLIGLELSSHTKPLDIKNHILYVAADHPGWMQRLMMNQAVILRKIRKEFPLLDIETMVFQQVSSFNSLEAARQENKEAQKIDVEDVSSETIEKVEQSFKGIESIKDDTFRNALKSLKKTMEDQKSKN